MTSIGRRAFSLAVAAPLAASLLGGCVYSKERTTERVVPTAPAPVVAAPAPPAQVVVTPAPPAPVLTAPAPSAPVVVTPRTDTVIVTTPSDRVVSYPEGSYRLHGDASRGYYWVWTPAGTTFAAPPVPPAVPRATQDTVIVSQPGKVVTYTNGRYELYGDGGSGYYWVWIPNGFTPPALPPAPPRISQSP